MSVNIPLFLIGALLSLTPLTPQKASPPPRTITFGGQEWTVKKSEGKYGPGPNYFSDAQENVSVDKEGRLHLKITYRDGKWQCAEVISKKSFGYGTYRFDIANSTQFDPQIVWGLFTWHDTDTAYHNREIDIEFSRWTKKEDDKEKENAQFVVQPYERPENIRRFTIPAEVAASTHSFTWLPDQVQFQSRRLTAQPPKPEDTLQSWTYRGADIPKPGGEQLHINLWLFRGKPPTDGKEQEVVIQQFRQETLK